MESVAIVQILSIICSIIIGVIAICLFARLDVMPPEKQRRSLWTIMLLCGSLFAFSFNDIFKPHTNYGMIILFLMVYASCISKLIRLNKGSK